jgi:hypothetical protein
MIVIAARDYEPIYYERYIDMHNKSSNLQQATKDKLSKLRL